MNCNKLSVQTLAFHKITDAMLLSFSFVKRGLSVMVWASKSACYEIQPLAFYKTSDSFLLAFEFCKDRGLSVIV